MQDLQTLINLLTKGRKIHISILDVSGVLATDKTRVSFKNTIHSAEFCKIAKSTEMGLKLCLYCKRLANGKAVDGKACFFGECIYGLCEAAVPVLSGSSVLAVVYVGNCVRDRERTLLRIERTCRRSGVDRAMLVNALDGCEAGASPEELLSIGEIVGDYIKLLAKSNTERRKKQNWLVSAIKLHAEQTYKDAPTLSELGIIYHKNQKYLGRLFKSETGMDFSEYCLELRLANAERLLRETDEKIINIALDSGFNNISYFNRAFKEKYKMSPKSWRKTTNPTAKKG